MNRNAPRDGIAVPEGRTRHTLKDANQKEHQESAPHIEEGGKRFQGQLAFGNQIAGRRNVSEDVANEDQGHNLELVGD